MRKKENNMNYDLKNLVTQMYVLADKMDEGPLGLAQNTNLILRDCIRTELLCYLMYLSAADGTIVWQEARFIRDYLEYDLTIEDINQLIVQNQIYSTQFEEKVPFSMQVFVKADNTIYEVGCETGIFSNVSVSELFYSLFEQLGEELLACDGNVSDDEIHDLTKYLNMLKNYINSEVKGKR